MKLRSKIDGFMYYGKMGVDFSTSVVFYPNMKIRLGLIGARPNFYTISDNTNFRLGLANSTLYTWRIALKDDYHKITMDMLAYME